MYVFTVLFLQLFCKIENFPNQKLVGKKKLNFNRFVDSSVDEVIANYFGYVIGLNILTKVVL